MSVLLVTTWIEIAFSTSATPLVLLLLYTLLTSALNRGCKVFLVMNGLGLLFLSTSHIGVAVDRLINPREFLAPDVAANLPLFLHQLAYGTCTISMLLIIIERMIIGLKPKLYVDQRVPQWALVAVCIVSEIFIACSRCLFRGPTVNEKKLYTTAEIKQKLSILFLTIFDISAVVMVIVVHIRCSQNYNRIFFKSSLGTRYHLKEVITLTRVLIPVCCSSLVFRFFVLFLAYIAFGNEPVLDIYFTFIRFCCTAAAIVEPALLLCRHRLLRRRMRLLFGLSIGGALRTDIRDSATVADVYFNAFKKEINKGKNG